MNRSLPLFLVMFFLGRCAPRLIALEPDLRLVETDQGLKIQFTAESVVEFVKGNPLIFPEYTVQESKDLKLWYPNGASVPAEIGETGLPMRNLMVAVPSSLEAQQRFFRVESHVVLEAAALQGAKLEYAKFAGADARGANFENADLAHATFSGANLRNADLSGAWLAWADLSGADLAGAALDGAELSRAQFSNTIMPDGAVRTDDADAEYLALIASHQLLAPAPLVSRIHFELELIREAFPAMRSIHPFPEWELGAFLTLADPSQLDGLPHGTGLDAFFQQYPLLQSKRVRGSAYALVEFKQKYNPEILISLYQAAGGTKDTEPNGMWSAGDPEDIRVDLAAGKYTFIKGCECYPQQTFSFLVHDGKVEPLQ